MSKLFLLAISFYQRYLSFDKGVLMIFAPGGACKFEVSCSEYTKQQIMKHGLYKGLILGLKRLWRCR